MFSIGTECEVVAGVHCGAIVRLRERAGMTEDGAQQWRADCAGSRPIYVREDQVRPLADRFRALTRTAEER